MGYKVNNTSELENAQFGRDTLAAAEQLRADVAANPSVRPQFAAVLQYVFGMDPEEAHPDLQAGKGVPIKEYREDSLPQLQGKESLPLRLSHTLEDLPPLKPGETKATNAAVNFALRFVGQSETPGRDNHGPIVKYFAGKEGVQWCGATVHKVMGVAVSPKLFDQANYMSAASYQAEGKKYQAFHSRGSDYMPVPGDVISFSRGKGKTHVGIVTAVSETGEVEYLAGNHGNAVRLSHFDGKNPPKSLQGYVEVQELAKKKGISLDAPAANINVPEFVANNPVRPLQSSKHSVSTYRGG